ncbi:hypothetical protein VTN02DRAFT_3560 [Thermoascus thermophilus]
MDRGSSTLPKNAVDIRSLNERTRSASEHPRFFTLQPHHIVAPMKSHKSTTCAELRSKRPAGETGAGA